MVGALPKLSTRKREKVLHAFTYMLILARYVNGNYDPLEPGYLLTWCDLGRPWSMVQLEAYLSLWKATIWKASRTVGRVVFSIAIEVLNAQCCTRHWAAMTVAPGSCIWCSHIVCCKILWQAIGKQWEKWENLRKTLGKVGKP